MHKLTTVLIIILLSVMPVLAPEETTTTEPVTTTTPTTTEPVTTTVITTTEEVITTTEEAITTTEVVTTTVPTVPGTTAPVETTTTVASVCGNGVCESGENSDNCPRDCGLPSPVCGNKICEQAEDRGGTYECVVDCGVDCDMDGRKDLWECARSICGNGVCEEGEDVFNCERDCRKLCPDFKTCPDDYRAPCYYEQSENACKCEPCPEQIPPGCRKEVDEQGYVRVVCERMCPEISPYEKERCINAGGNPILRKDQAGCDFMDCQLQPAPSVVNPITGYENCPPEEEIKHVLEKCEMMGEEGRIVWEGGCKIAKCVREQYGQEDCGFLSPDFRMQVEEECRRRGLGVVRTFGPDGCPTIDCSFEDCPRDVPPEAYEKCNERGGELVVKRNTAGCIEFSDCIMRGDERMAYVEQIDRVPEATELLSMAFKLEELKMELDRLSRQADDIANYYASVGSPDEERFRRVADMFQAAKENVDRIKMKLRERVDSITIDDMMEIRQDIRYIKDVMFKDILYVMLSTNEDVSDLRTEGDCGQDGGCFDRAFRVCKPVVFYPEGRDNIRVEITGLEDSKCKLYAVLPEDKGPPPGVISGIDPPYEMTCFIPNYAMGARNPETDILPYCEGNLLKMMAGTVTSAAKAPTGPTQEPRPIEESCWCEDNGQCERFECKSCLDCGGPGCICEDNGQCEPRECPECRDCRGAGEEIREACSGCLDNNVCDPGECSYCNDCR